MVHGERSQQNWPHHHRGRITTAGVITAFPAPPGTAGGWITAAPDGALWFTGGYSEIIGRITTAGLVTEYPILGPGNGFSDGITAGPDGYLWFSECLAKV